MQQTIFDGFFLYMEGMKQLPVTAPDIYANFCQEKFVIKHTIGQFKLVGVDMALEQTINCSQNVNLVLLE